MSRIRFTKKNVKNSLHLSTSPLPPSRRRPNPNHVRLLTRIRNLNGYVPKTRISALSGALAGAGAQAGGLGGVEIGEFPTGPRRRRRVRGRVARRRQQALRDLLRNPPIFSSRSPWRLTVPSAGAETIKSDLHLANRLDRDTSGLMVITKSNKVAGKFVKAFTNHKVKKTYIALCIGRAPNWGKIRISSGHGRSKFGAWRVYAASDVGRTLPGGSMVRDMTTSFKVLSINGEGKFREPAELDDDAIESVVVEEKGAEWNGDNEHEKRDEILIRAYPQSGRTHQIRLHCQYLGIPIKGDVKYEGVHDWRGLACDGHALHAESLSFKHPVTSEYVCFHAPVPSWVDEIQNHELSI